MECVAPILFHIVIFYKSNYSYYYLTFILAADSTEDSVDLVVLWVTDYSARTPISSSFLSFTPSLSDCVSTLAMYIKQAFSPRYPTKQHCQYLYRSTCSCQSFFDGSDLAPLVSSATAHIRHVEMASNQWILMAAAEATFNQQHELPTSHRES
ncbi:hypothetical protein CI102_1880 [Trichoderma harzianum]|nr:hypothetical protein CI102_1880 [Trichoderma harzianum]